MRLTCFLALIVFVAVGIPDDEIGIGADGDRALLGIDVEDARDVGRGDGDELLLGQPPGVDARRPQHRHAVLEPAGAVGDLGEVLGAHALLLGREGAMVGRHHLQRARLQPGPQRILVLLVRKGGDITRRAA